MGGGGGGSTDIEERDFNEELPDIRQGYKFQTNQLDRFGRKQPLLKAAEGGALDFFGQLGDLLGPLGDLFGNLKSIDPTISKLRGQFGGLPQQILGTSTTLQRQFGGLPSQLQRQFGRLPAQLQAQFGGLPGQLMGLTKPLQSTATGYLSGILGSQGALSPEAARDVAQQTRTLAGQYGTGRQLGTLGTELLNRQGAREARYNTALGQYNAATGQISALDQAAQGLGIGLAEARQGLGTGLAQVRQGLGTGLAQTRAGLGQLSQGLGLGLASGLQGLRSQDIAQRTGLAGAIQNLQTGGLNQLLGAEQGKVNAFSATTNPILSYLSNLFGGNLQARTAQAQINQQGNIASDNKTAGLISGALSSIGSIAGAAAMSDERVKKNIRDTGLTTSEGIPLKTWEYKDFRKGERFLSPLAQDVEKKLPNQVLSDPVSGVKFMIGFPVVKVSPLKRKAA